MADTKEAAPKSGLLEEIYNCLHRAQAPCAPRSYLEDVENEAYEETRPFWGKDWGDLSLRDFEDHNRVLSFVPDNDWPYYLGALMWLSVKANNVEVLNEVISSGVATGASARSRKSALARKSVLLSTSQRAVVIKYLCWHIEKTAEFWRPAILNLIDEVSSI